MNSKKNLLFESDAFNYNRAKKDMKTIMRFLSGDFEKSSIVSESGSNI